MTANKEEAYEKLFEDNLNELILARVYVNIITFFIEWEN